MPVHGIKLDLEFLAIVTGAVAVSYFISGMIVSNALFTTLIAILFFLIGLHLDTDKLRKCAHHPHETFLGLGFIYMMAPLTAFLLASYFGGSLGDAFIAIGVSAASLGSPVVFSNLSRGEGDLAVIVSGAALLVGIAIIPLLLFGLNATVPVKDIAINNLLFLGLPLIIGIGSQRFENFLIDDLRHHFSKVALWLLVLVFGVQFKLLYETQGLSILGSLGTGAAALVGFALFSFLAAYLVSRGLGVMERKARALGFVAGSKNIAIALFIASQISGEVVAYVSVYYFVRQAVNFGMVEVFRNHDSLPSEIDRYIPNPSPE